MFAKKTSILFLMVSTTMNLLFKNLLVKVKGGGDVNGLPFSSQNI